MLGILKTVVRFAALALLAAATLAVLPAPPASAGAIAILVTTTADVVDAGDGVTSLREAVAQASGDPSSQGITLQSGQTYPLTRCGAGVDQGALQLAHDGPFTIAGAAVVEQTCEDEKVLEVQGDGTGEHRLVDVTFRSSAEAPDGLLYLSPPTELDGVVLTGAFGDQPAVLASDRLEVVESTFDALAGTSHILWGAPVEVEGSAITDSTADIGIQAEGFSADGLEISGNTFSDNLALLFNSVHASGLQVRDNEGMPAGMILAGADRVSEVPASPIVEPFVIEDSAFVGNTLLGTSPGPCCPVLGFQDVDAEVSGTSIFENVGFRYAVATYSEDVAPKVLHLQNSTVAFNSGPTGSTAVSSPGPLTLHHASIVANAWQDDGSNEVAAASMQTTASLIKGAGASCDVDVVTSHGGNVDDDGSCDLDQASDRSDVGDDVGGWTISPSTDEMPVVVPMADAVVVDTLPGADCAGDLTFDQIGRERPQGSGCDAGAVELLQPFSDVPPSHPFFDDIAWAASEGIAGGFEDGTYRPSLPVSRQAMAAFLYRMAGEPDIAVPTPPTFSDVGVSHPFRTEVEWLADSGITGGYGDGTFRPSLPVSRQAMAAFLYRRAGEPAFTPPSPPTFPDVGTTNPFRLEVEWLVDEGIADGYQDGTFKPANAVSRQAMAAFLHRIASD